ncbi:39S ribosomal protein L49, mitochondrial isoform X1 [Molothrus ater]|uniref:39S ribosomal protein L49, mitochondrial isoform X1 n=1 Tax=Molothrus ater TaxID=84834 RepID=UPI0023E7D91A|nr:39S ribosomal protein L49, mitochondrial isoform X1 [Molothrus ater]
MRSRRPSSGSWSGCCPPAASPTPPRTPNTPPRPDGAPPQTPPPDLPYFVRRSRLHNLPVYLGLRQGRRLTELRRIHGDIWALERDLRAFLGSQGVPEVAAQVNEVTGTLRLRGHWGAQVRQWLLQRGF